MPRLVARTVASVACFFFIFIWHGEEEYVLYWVLLNFGAVTVEALGREIYRTEAVRNKLAVTLSAENQRRLHCLLASPLHYFSMLSNYFFIGSLEVGKIYFSRAIRGKALHFSVFSKSPCIQNHSLTNSCVSESAINTLYILFFLYGAAQTTVSIEGWERKNL